MKPPRLDPNASNDPKDWITVTGPACPPGKPLDNVIAAVKERGGKVLGRFTVTIPEEPKA